MDDYKIIKCSSPKKAVQRGTSTNIKPKRLKNGDIIFSDHPEFKPNLTPKEMFHSGIFGGTLDSLGKFAIRVAVATR